MIPCGTGISGCTCITRNGEGVCLTWSPGYRA
jgi:hypothetical protein